MRVAPGISIIQQKDLMPMTIDEVLRADVIDKAVPATLRSVAPFLEEAQSILRYLQHIDLQFTALY